MAPQDSNSEPLSPLHRAVLITVLYSDLFDHPLTGDELHHFLTAPCPDRETLDRAIEDLNGRYLGTAQGFVFRTGRESTIDVRQRRHRLASKRWPPAQRFARWLGRVPFLRMVAVCGSQAMENGDDDGDVDLFLITEPGRLWLVQSITMVLRRIGRGLGIDICPNYLLASNTLELKARNLYTAREASQAMPLWGESTYNDFLSANGWIRDFLPQRALGDRQRFLAEIPRRRSTRTLEWLLSGRLGDLADHAVHRVLLLYYRARLRHHGWQRQDIEKAYRRDRQVVVTGGYSAAVAQRFIDHGVRELGDVFSASELRAAFFGQTTDPTDALNNDRETPDPLYAGLMATRYGGGS